MSLTIPNIITLLRIALIPWFLTVLLHGEVRGALLIVGLAGLSDALDGFIARFFHQQSRLGAYLDPVADKLLLTSAYIALTLPAARPGPRIPVWVTALVLTRDVLLVVAGLVLYLTAGVRRFPPTVLSKLTTFFQLGTVLLVLVSSLWPGLESSAWATLYTAAALTLASGLHYVYRTRDLLASRPRSAAPPPA